MDELVKQLVLANAALQQANAEQRKTNTALQQQTEAVQQQAMALCESLAAAAEADRRTAEADRKAVTELVQQLMARNQEGQVLVPGSGGAIRASHFLQKLTPHDDVEAFLHTFERTAEREAWPKAQWAGLVAPFLTGDAQKAYFDLALEDAKDYDKLKDEVLRRLGVTPAVRAQRVHQWTYSAANSPRSQMHDLIHLVKKWLEPEKLTAPQVVERVTIDRFLRSLPPTLRRWVSHADPQSADQLIALVERYLAAEDSLAWATSQRSSTRRLAAPQGTGKTKADLMGGVVSEPSAAGRGRPVAIRNRPQVQCWQCKDWGHIAANCPQAVEPMECEYTRRRSFYARPVFVASSESHLAVVKIAEKTVQALLDSGSLVTLVHASLVDTSLLGSRRVTVQCVHGDSKQYPTALLTIETNCGPATQEVVVSPNLAHSVILGRDFPLFWNLWEGGNVRASREPEYKNVMETDNNEVCSPLEVFAGDSELSPETSEGSVLPELEVSRDNFGTVQLRDPTLAKAWENVKVLNGEPQVMGAEKVFPHLAVQSDLLYQVCKIQGEVVEQLVVPKSYRTMVLDLAHKHALGGHLGTEKTRERVLQRFFWPGVHGDVKAYCESCPECQRCAPAPHFRSPLVPLPVIEVPFERIAMDLVGPLVRSARGHQYILVVLDYATRYPEAIPLRNTSSKLIARELFHMFTRVGLPKEILTDQGTPFMSKLMKEVCKLMKIDQIRTSVYHPQTDGLVERFNKTLKSMLKKVVDQDGKDWNCLLPYLLFAIREVPQSSTGFSPFELLYGRRPRGILDIAKETWEQEATPYKSVIEHVSGMQDRIAAVMPLVREHLQQAQEAQSRVYNKSAKVRTFNPGDRVLVLVPTVESKFLAKWQGPYEVVEKVGEVNYRVFQPGRRKPQQIYHVNLLKPWKERVALAASQVTQEPTKGGIELVQVADALSVSQKREVREFLLRNQEVFSELPGCTQVVRHDIVTEPHVQVRLKPYRIPEARRQAIAGEVERMLELGVIEESNSEWNSPIVLVPKPDGSIRFCNDFRKLNEVSKFDAYPMPRVDELVERLGPARYVTTLDLTRGYWQVPLTESAKEKTAFSTPQGLFQYVRMPFGLQGAPATFQRMMDKILRPHQMYAAAYLDDVVVFSADWESHLPKVQAVLDAIRKAGLTANPKKCAVGLEEARYLGYTIGRGLIKPQVQKVEAIRDWPRPTTKKQVRTFLGLVGYYRRFIPNFATLATPITNLTKGKSSSMISWGPEAEEAFQGLKEALCRGPVLITPDFKKEFLVQTDASAVGLGAVLSQLVNGEEHPVVYLSRRLTAAEERYSIVERECLAIKWALEALRYYLLGRRFRLITDHAPLTWMSQNKEKNARVTRWFLALQPFNFSVEHRAGRLHGNADALSRAFCLAADCVRSHGIEQRGGVCDKVDTQESIDLSQVVFDGRYIPPGIRRYVR